MGPGKDNHGTPVPTQWEGRGWLDRTALLTQHKDASPRWDPRMVAEHVTDPRPQCTTTATPRHVRRPHRTREN